jgi:PadR family transcriptional regulator PadR
MRKTKATKSVAELLSALDNPVWGLEVCRRLALMPGTVYPILQRMELAGWVTSQWEAPEEKTSGPRRRIYAVTPEGRLELTEYLETKPSVRIEPRVERKLKPN